MCAPDVLQLQQDRFAAHNRSAADPEMAARKKERKKIPPPKITPLHLLTKKVCQFQKVVTKAAAAAAAGGEDHHFYFLQSTICLC